MKDVIGNTIEVGSIVAFIDARDVYNVSIRRANVIGVKNGMLQCRDGDQLLQNKENNGIYNKVVRIPSEGTVEDDTVDAVGQLLEVGKRIVARMDRSVNDKKQFTGPYTITRITNSFVYFNNEEGKEVRKGFNRVVVV